MKILIAGDWHSELHEEAAAIALNRLGHTVVRFPWHGYFNVTRPQHFFPLGSSWMKLQNKFAVGPIVDRINEELASLVRESRADVLFLYRGTHIRQQTLMRIRRDNPRIMLVGYNNDDPFAPGQPFWLWRHFIACVPELDLVMAYRKHNIDEFRAAGARNIGLLRSWFVAEQNRPVELSSIQREIFGCDVVFVGHYEPDGRLELLEQVVQNGFKLRLFGPGYEWDSILKRSRWLRNHGPVNLVWGEDYNRAICGARLALCFLSKLNRDSYTRRCFEIPAAGRFLFSEYSEDLASLFSEGVEAEYFRSTSEFVDKLRHYLQNPLKLEAVALAGHRRVLADGHDVLSRMKSFVSLIEAVSANGRK